MLTRFSLAVHSRFAKCDIPLPWASLALVVLVLFSSLTGCSKDPIDTAKGEGHQSSTDVTMEPPVAGSGAIRGIVLGFEKIWPSRAVWVYMAQFYGDEDGRDR